MVDLGVTTGPLLRWLSIFSESLASLSPRLPISFFLLPPLKLEESSFLFFFSFQIEDWEILIHYVFYWLCEILLRVTWNTCLRLIIELKSWQNFCLVGLFIVCRIILTFVRCTIIEFQKLHNAFLVCISKSYFWSNWLFV